MRRLSSWRLLVVCGFFACGGPERDNPYDSRFIGREEPGIQLVADFPAGQELGPLMSSVRFVVQAPGLAAPVQGDMNLVGGQARAEVRGVPAGPARIFRVEAFDANLIRTFAATDTLTVEDPPQQVHLRLARLRGSLELSAQLPPEIVELEVQIVADGDTLRRTYQVEGLNEERIGEIPTGTGVRVELTGRDDQQQIMLRRELEADVRDDLIAHLAFSAEVGALQITARFPTYVPRATIDRFSDEAGLFYRRSDNAKLPKPDQAIDFDNPLFLQRGFGPNGEILWFYNFDAKGIAPPPVYVLVDRIGQPIPGQLPIFDLLPGDPGYSDLWQIYKVRILQRDYALNSLSSLQALQEGAYEITATDEVMQCVLVPSGSKASQRFDASTPIDPQQGWYRDQIVDYLLFENPNSTAQVDFGAGKINAPEMFAFFENDADPSDGFALDPLATGTHNVATRLPGQEGYAPLWVLTIFKLDFFDRVKSVANALDQSRDETSLLTLPELLYVDAPIVKVE